MWFRRDLRLADLPALHAAAAESARVVPLFVVDPAFATAGAPRRAFMAASLQALDDAIGGALVYRHGNPTQVVPSLVAEVGAHDVYVSRDYGPYGRTRDAAVGEALQSMGARLLGVGSPYAVSPGDVNKADGSPYAVFTPFSRTWRAIGWDAPLAAPDVAWHGAPTVSSDDPPAQPELRAELPAAGEEAAHRRWDEFLPRLDDYRDLRNLPGVDGTSHMSAALRWGLVHPRQLLAELTSSPGPDTFAGELAWREFYADVLFRQPGSAWQNLNSRMNAM